MREFVLDKFLEASAPSQPKEDEESTENFTKPGDRFEYAYAKLTANKKRIAYSYLEFFYDCKGNSRDLQNEIEEESFTSEDVQDMIDLYGDGNFAFLSREKTKRYSSMPSKQFKYAQMFESCYGLAPFFFNDPRILECVSFAH